MIVIMKAYIYGSVWGILVGGDYVFEDVDRLGVD